VETVQRGGSAHEMIRNNRNKIAFQFSWEKIIDEYEAFITACYQSKQHELIVPYQG
jgi:glycosyltransferase involved in cell wall biosynthesis